MTEPRKPREFYMDHVLRNESPMRWILELNLRTLIALPFMLLFFILMGMGLAFIIPAMGVNWVIERVIK